MGELMKPVSGYEGLYYVTDTGKIYGEKSQKWLKPSLTDRGYCRVKLYKNAVGNSIFIHRLVAETFIPNPDNKPQINHKDGNKTNNSIDNLEWVTQMENNIHAIRTGLNSTKNAVRSNMKKVRQYSREGEFIKEWDSMSEAGRRLNIPVANITHCCKGRIRHAGGYVWQV